MGYSKCFFCSERTSSNESTSILKAEENGMDIVRKSKNCLGVWATTPLDLSDIVCIQCVHEIDNFNDFLQKCVNADMMMKDKASIKMEKFNQKGAEQVNLVNETLNSDCDPDQPLTNVSKLVDSNLSIGNTLESQEETSRGLVKAVHREKSTSTINHFRGGTSDELNTYRICNKTMYTESTWKRHKCINADEKFFSCEICKKFPSKCSSKDHLPTHLNTKPYFSSFCERKGKYNGSMWRPTGLENYSCDICKRSFKKHSFLQHSPCAEEKYECNICGKKYRRKGSLAMHSVVHMIEKPYQCDICKKFFNQRPSLNDHMLCHTGERPFQCDMCKKSFRVKSHLRDHMRCHTGEKPFQCDTCKKSFKMNLHLKIHVRCHTGEKPFQCDMCKKYFRQRPGLTTHMRCHTGEKPFQCDICKKFFRQRPGLTTHMLCHMGEKQFQCDRCKKYFTQRSTLNTHMLCHTDEKQFHCDICGKTFKLKPYLILHMRCHSSMTYG